MAVTSTRRGDHAGIARLGGLEKVTRGARASTHRPPWAPRCGAALRGLTGPKRFAQLPKASRRCHFSPQLARRTTEGVFSTVSALPCVQLL